MAGCCIHDKESFGSTEERIFFITWVDTNFLMKILPYQVTVRLCGTASTVKVVENLRVRNGKGVISLK